MGVIVFNTVLKTVWKTIQMVKQHIKIVQKRYFLCYFSLYYCFFSTFMLNSVLKTGWKVWKTPQSIGKLWFNAHFIPICHTKASVAILNVVKEL